MTKNRNQKIGIRGKKKIDRRQSWYLKNTCFLFILFLFSTMSYAIDLSQITFGENRIYNDAIKTTLLFPPNFPFATPVIQMNSNDVLELQFDNISDDVADLSYTVLQCDYQWVPTQLNQFEYIDGFSESNITDYDQSFNTTVDYVHYRLRIPNNDMQFTKSGNFVIVVFDNDSEEILFTRRFMVFEPRVEIDGNIFLPNNPLKRTLLQDVQFNVLHKGFEINSPIQEINAVILQNERPDNAIVGLKPLMFGFDELRFNHHMKAVFETGKEHRWFDMRSLRFRGDGIGTFDAYDGENHVYLLPEGSRSELPYKYEEDLNGKFIIDMIESPHEQIEGDYAYVHFEYLSPKFIGKEVYVIGGFNDWKQSPENKMTYDSKSGMYKTSIFLKQGFYNYAYATVPLDGGQFDLSLTEGHFYDTENDYTIYIYQRPFGELYDRLIGIQYLNTTRNRF